MPYYSTEIERLGENCEKTGKLFRPARSEFYFGPDAGSAEKTALQGAVFPIGFYLAF